MKRRLPRYFVAAAWASSCFDAALAATLTCRSDADCSPPATLCRSFSLSKPPQRLCIPPIPATALSTDGANNPEREQEQRITRLLGALSEYVNALQPKTLSELRDVLDREVRASRLDEAALKRHVTQAHAALQQLDHYERLVLARYLQRQFSTELERWLFIILDIVRHPDLDPSTEIAALDIRIAAEELRLKGIVSDRASQCAQIPVVVELYRQKYAAMLALETRRIEASNFSSEQRAALIENARRWMRNIEERTSAIRLGDCGGNAASPGPIAVPPMPAMSKRERARYTLYSLDSPEMVVLADAAGIPPVSSGAWDGTRVGKRFAQQQARSEQTKRASEGRRPFARQAEEERAAAVKLFEAEMNATIGSCRGAEACDAAIKAVQKRYEGRIGTAADRLKAAPAGDPPVMKPPSYAGLQPYDEDGQFVKRRFPKTDFWPWIFNMLAENFAVEAIEHFTHIKLDPLPPSMVNKLHVAKQLAGFADAKTPREVACRGAVLHKELTVPFAPNIGERINLMTQSVMQLKDPTDPGFKDCRKETK
jgi:hypothetical protein